eukprot:80008_1
MGNTANNTDKKPNSVTTSRSRSTQNKGLTMYERLLSMGFSDKLAFKAANKFPNDINNAMDWINKHEHKKQNIKSSELKSDDSQYEFVNDIKFKPSGKSGGLMGGVQFKGISKKNIDEFLQLDKAIGIYYRQLGENDYFNSDNVGKFLYYSQDGELGANNLPADVLGTHATAEDCVYTRFDSQFPFHYQVQKLMKENNVNANEVIFYILHHCYLHKTPPSEQDILSRLESMTIQNVQVDIDIFINTSTECDGTVNNCDHTNRFMSCMAYYKMLDLPSNEDNKSIFVEFCTNIYTNLVDDSVHLLNKHGNELVELKSLLITKYSFSECKMSNCRLTQRHQRSRNSEQKQNQDPMFTFYDDLISRLHFNIFHLFEVGLRQKQNTDQKQNTETDEDEYFNKKFYRMDTVILHQEQQQRKKVSLQRFKSTSKFNLFTNTSVPTNIPSADEEIVFMESAIEHLDQHTNIPSHVLIQFQEFLVDEEYDSDVLQIEFDSVENKKHWPQSNIYLKFSNSLLMSSLHQFISPRKLHQVSLSVGWRFYYWAFYQNLDNEYGSWNFLHPGYSPKDLFVKRKYSSFKEEILNCGFINVAVYQSQILLKAQEYFVTQKVKEMVAEEMNPDIHYGIDEGTPIRLQNIMSVFAYCDFTELCTHFSATFRKKNFWEPLESLKQRNSNYWHMSKLLRETVECFGDTGNFKYNDDGEKISGERGPFYCGMSIVLNIPSFAIYLKGPCSTSKEMAVSLNFAKRDGIVIQLQNDSGNGSRQRFLDCSFVSNYVEEAEMLFIAGDYRLRIESIRIIETAQNFQKFFCSFYLFDCMISGVRNYEFKISSSDKKILSR